MLRPDQSFSVDELIVIATAIKKNIDDYLDYPVSARLVHHLYREGTSITTPERINIQKKEGPIRPNFKG